MLLEINLVAVREELLSTIEEGLLLGALVVKEARLGLNCPGWHVFSNKTSKVQIALLSNYHKERERERERELGLNQFQHPRHQSANTLAKYAQNIKKFVACIEDLPEFPPEQQKNNVAQVF